MGEGGEGDRGALTAGALLGLLWLHAPLVLCLGEGRGRRRLGPLEQESPDCWFLKLWTSMSRNTSSSMGTLGCWGRQHPEQAELPLLLHLAEALGLRRSRRGSGGGILLLFEGPESGHVLEKPVWWRAETKARGMVCISRPPV